MRFFYATHLAGVFLLRGVFLCQLGLLGLQLLLLLFDGEVEVLLGLLHKVFVILFFVVFRFLLQGKNMNNVCYNLYMILAFAGSPVKFYTLIP